MRNSGYLIIIIFIGVLLTSCSGSETYRGEWKATDSNGTHLDITFQEKSFSVKNGTNSSSFGYTQNSVSVENSVETYGIEVDDGRSFQIQFPVANDKSKAIVLGLYDNVIYTISRGSYISHDDIYKLE